MTRGSRHTLGSVFLLLGVQACGGGPTEPECDYSDPDYLCHPPVRYEWLDIVPVGENLPTCLAWDYRKYFPYYGTPGICYKLRVGSSATFEARYEGVPKDVSWLLHNGYWPPGESRPDGVQLSGVHGPRVTVTAIREGPTILMVGGGGSISTFIYRGEIMLVAE